MSRIRHVRLVLLLLAGIAAGSGVAAISAVSAFGEDAQEKPPQAVRLSDDGVSPESPSPGSELRVGDVVGYGEPTADGLCQFSDPIGIEVWAGDDPDRSLDVAWHFDEECVARVSEISQIDPHAETDPGELDGEFIPVDEIDP